MSIIQNLINKFRAKPPVIPTAFGGPVPEHMRLQAETNMRLDPELREKVLAVLIKEANGDVRAGVKEFKRRYPKGGLV
jgi:hypothetical protein